MMTVEIKVNGSIVAALCAIKIDNHFDPDSSTYVGTYEYQGASFPINNQGPCNTVHGKLTHVVRDGIEVLAAKLCAKAAGALGHPLSVNKLENDDATGDGSARETKRKAEGKS